MHLATWKVSSILICDNFIFAKAQEILLSINVIRTGTFTYLTPCSRFLLINVMNTIKLDRRVLRATAKNFIVYVMPAMCVTFV